MLREFDDRDPPDWRPSPVAQYLIGGVATLIMLAIIISGISAVLS